ncbi:MAG: MASE3 domain-containing protein [Ignavibacteriaceae bacterium]
MIREENYINKKLNKKGKFIQYFNKNSITFSLIIIIVTLFLYLISLDNYLLFHSLAESFSIVISCGIFMVIWNSRRYIDNNFFIIIGIALLFVSFLDLIHTFTYKGINIIPGHSTNLPTQIWIASRFLEGITYLAAPFFIGKKVRTSYIFYTYVLVTSVLLASIFYWKIFPQCFIEGYGLTPFKKISEYVISLFLVGAIYFLYKKKDSFDRYLFYMIEFSIALTILSELIFTLYATAYGFFNFAGHILKIFSFYVIYKAIIVVGLKNPFNTLFSRLKQKEEDLQLTRFSVDKADDFILWISPDGYITDVNDTTSLRLNYTKDEIIGLPFVLIDTEFNLEKFQAIKNKSLVTEHYFKTKDGDKVPVEVDNAPAMIWMSDVDKSRIYYNRRWLEFTGNNLEQELSNDWLESVHSEDREHVRKNFDDAFNQRKEFNFEYRLKRYNGQYRWIFDTGIPRFTPDGNFLGYIGSCYDITERKQSRQQIELSLTEKVTLLKEIHHRVKNNLQVISSLLRLQSSYIKDDEAREIFIESQNRIRSMALIHQKLYLSKDLTHINFANYINELVSSLLSSFKFNSNNIIGFKFV